MSFIMTSFIVASLLLRLLPVDAQDLQSATPTYSPLTLPVQVSQIDARAVAPVKKDPRRLGVVTSAVSALVIDRASGVILFEKNRAAPRSIGSITKLMTAYVFLESQPDVTATATLLPEDVRLGGVQHLAIGETYVVRDLVYASLISSDNSATAALMRLSGMAPGDFVAKMNETAALIGMEQTHFVDPTGLSAKNVSVVMDIARLVDHISKHEIIRDATTHASFTIQSLSGNAYSFSNTNDLLTSFMNVDPYKIVTAKTGYLPEAGYCLGAMFSREGKNDVIAVVLGSDSDLGRFHDVKAMAAWAYDAWEWN